MPKKIFEVVSLFSGCGGMDLGIMGGFHFNGVNYKRNPFQVIAANDINKAACRTYERNLGEDIFCGDIRDYLSKLPQADVIIGGFPCQDISVNNRRGTGVKGARSGLYKLMAEAVERYQPAAFVAENVRGLLMRHNKESLRAVIDDFSSLGYHVSYSLYNAADYGVPQTRERVFIFGSKYEPVVGPAATHLPNERVSADAVLDNLINRPRDPYFSHIWSEAKRSPDQGDRILKRGRPGYTIRAECHGNIQWHYELNRRISMREAARLQSFPDSFLFECGIRETERELGNAVPPVLAWHMSRSLSDHLSRWT